MWKLLLITLYTLNCCWAGPVVLKKNMPIKEQMESPSENKDINSSNDIKINEQRQWKREDSRSLQSKMMKIQTLSLPSNATSIRANIIEGFSCQNRSYGYYADIENDCQIFHVCLPVIYPNGKESIFRWSFICPEETVFSQDSFICMRPDDMTITCEESYQYYELNRNFGIIDNVIEMDKDVDNTIISNLSEHLEQSGQIDQDGQYETMPEMTTFNQYDDKINNKPIKQPIHRPNRPKPNFTFMHNRPKISTQPLRKVPSSIETDNTINENHDNSALNLEQTEKEEKDNKLSTQRYIKRPLLSMSKEKISSNKHEDKVISKLSIYNSKPKRPAVFNNKKLISPSATTSTSTTALVEENSELTKTDKSEHKFIKLESESKPNLSNKYLETEMADADSQSSEKKIITVKPEEQINTVSEMNTEISDILRKAEETINLDTQEKETIDSKLIGNESDEISNKIKRIEKVTDVEKESDNSQTSYVEQTFEKIPISNDKLEESNMAISNKPDIINDNMPFIASNDKVQSVNLQYHSIEQIPEESPKDDKQVENVETDSSIGNNQEVIINQDKSSDKSEDMNANDFHMKVITDGTSDEVATESVSHVDQPVEEMEAEKPLGAPESVSATDDMLQQSASIQEMFGEFKPTNSIEAEKLIMDFINKMSNTEENPFIVPFELDKTLSINNEATIPNLNADKQIINSKKNTPNTDSDAGATHVELPQEEVEIFNKDMSENADVSLERDTSEEASKVFPIRDDTFAENSGISDDQISIYSESINKHPNANQEDQFNLEKLFPFNEPQIMEDNIRMNDTTDPEKSSLTNSKSYNQAASNIYNNENSRPVNFDDVIEMVKEHMPSPQNEMNHQYNQKMPLTNENVDKTALYKYGIEDDAGSDIIQTNTEEYIVPIYHRIINTNEANSESSGQQDANQNNDIISDTLTS